MTEPIMTLGENVRKVGVDLDNDFLREGVALQVEERLRSRGSQIGEEVRIRLGIPCPHRRQKHQRQVLLQILDVIPRQPLLLDVPRQRGLKGIVACARGGQRCGSTMLPGG